MGHLGCIWDLLNAWDPCIAAYNGSHGAQRTTHPTPKFPLSQVAVDLGSPSSLSAWSLGNGDPCANAWPYVTCSGSPAVVTGINLGARSLSTSLPASLAHVLTLTSLQLGSNALIGTLPAAWSTLTLLTNLDVDTNALTGPLPPKWSTLTRLQRLNLGYNFLTGTIPVVWSSLTALTKLLLTNNAAVCGTVPPVLSGTGRVTATGTVIPGSCPLPPSPPPSPSPPPPGSIGGIYLFRSVM